MPSTRETPNARTPATGSSAPTAAADVVRDAVLLASRVLVGVIMIAHGWQKVADKGLDATAAGWASNGIPFPQFSAVFAAAAEIGGGLLLILGFLTPLAGLAITVVLFGAFWFVHRGAGLFVREGGWELVAALGCAALMLAVVGPGRFSLDEVVFARRRRRRGGSRAHG